ncbi:MAG: Ig-like domain-containing protein, partial [Cytophagales bacterium]|nr:Ig-like domain-containing protein [Cytophagales bacterium]
VRDLIGSPATAPPPAPQGLTATPVGNANVNLSWSAAPDANSYTVKRSTTSGGPYTAVGTTLTTGLSDNTVTNGTTYYYVVSATNALGESANSGEVSVTPTAVVTIRREFWLNVAGTGITAIPLTTPPTGTEELTALDAPQNIGDNYGARMRAYLKPPTSGAYTFYIASDDQSQLWLSTNNQSAGKAKLAEVTDWTSYGQWDKLGTQRSAAVNLVAGQEYYLEVLHKEGTGGDHVEVGWTGPGIAAITIIGSPYLAPYTGSDAPTGPAAPTGLAATAGNASVSLTWNAVAGATTYNVKRHTGGNFNTVATGVTTNSYQDNNLVNGTTYFYVVTAVNANGESNISNTVQVTPVGGGGSPSGILASWDFTASSGQTSVATPTAMPGVSTTAPSLVASLASGLTAVDYFTNSLIGRGQTATSLADAIAGNDYISFTVAPASGRTLSISSVKIRPLSQNGARTFVLLSNVSGFTAGNEISTFTADGVGTPLTTINVTGHTNLGSAVEFRLYAFGNTNEWEAVGMGSRAASLAEADLIVEGSVGTASAVAVTGVSLSPASVDLTVGSTRQLTATVSPANATNKNVSWSSSNPSVATVNATGLVTAVASGSATITVTTQDGSFAATTAVTVPEVVVPDTQAPTAPANLVASAITATGFTLTWAASTDNVGVTAYKVYRNDVLVATTPNTTAGLTGLSPQTAYAVKVSAEDAAGNTATSGVITVTTLAPAPVTLTREVWSNLSGKGIAGIPVDKAPTSTTQLTTLEGPTDAADNYGARIRAYITPAVSGSYTFYLAGDDVAELWLSFNDNPGQKTKIAEVTKAVKPREWTKSPAQKSTARNLTAGVKYYVEVLHRETTGRDHVAVGWTGPGVPSVSLVPGSVLSPYVPAPGAAREAADGPSAGGLEGVTVYPNPTGGALFIRATPGRTLKASLTTMQGVQVNVAGRQSAAGDLHLDLSNQPAGIYLLRLEAGGRSKIYKIARQ